MQPALWVIFGTPVKSYGPGKPLDILRNNLSDSSPHEVWRGKDWSKIPEKVRKGKATLNNAVVGEIGHY